LDPIKPVGPPAGFLPGYDPDNPTGGGNFNPDMKIDLSHISPPKPELPPPAGQLRRGYRRSGRPDHGPYYPGRPDPDHGPYYPIEQSPAAELYAQQQVQRAAQQQRLDDQGAAWADNLNDDLTRALEQVLPPGAWVQWETGRE
jgi:hypothetical protein